VTKRSVDARVLFVDMLEDGMEGETTRCRFEYVGEWKSRCSRRRVDGPSLSPSACSSEPSEMPSGRLATLS
jgi:hypothetical protein